MKAFFSWTGAAALVLLMAGCTRETPSLQVDFPAVYVVNGASTSLTVIRSAAQEVAGTFPLNDPDMDHANHAAMISWPHHGSLSPDGTVLALAAPGIDLSAGHSGSHAGHGGHLLLLDAATGAVLFDKVLEAPNHNAAFSPDGTEVWTSAMEDSGAVLVFDARTLIQTHRLPAGNMPAEVTFSRDGSLAFVANGEDNTVSVYGVADKALKATIPVGHGPVGAWTGNDTTMLVDNETSMSLSILSTTRLGVADTLALGFMPGMAAWSNGRIWVTDATAGRLVVYAPAPGGGYAPEGAVATGAGAHGIAFSADGGTVWVTNQQANTVSIIRTADLTKVKTLSTGSRPNGVLVR